MFNPREPLGLPRGSVRAILAIGLVGATVGAVYVGINEQATAALIGLANGALLFYFQGRQTTERTIK